MQNKGNCGFGGFVPADSNWDFPPKPRCRTEVPCDVADCPVHARCRAEAPCDTADCPCPAPREKKPACPTPEPACACKRRAHPVGMVNVEIQSIGDLYAPENALRAGTLYPELHKPLNGYWPCREGWGDCAQELAFALWELRLYLNTHPCDQEALARFRQLCTQAEGTYAQAFLPKDLTRWAWTDDPWPWEYDGQRCK